jgi:hypothetical protein
VDVYWQLGENISKNMDSAQRGDGVVDELAAAIARRYHGMRGYTRPNLFRMRQFVTGHSAAFFLRATRLGREDAFS